MVELSDFLVTLRGATPKPGYNTWVPQYPSDVSPTAPAGPSHVARQSDPIYQGLKTFGTEAPRGYQGLNAAKEGSCDTAKLKINIGTALNRGY